MPDDRHDVFRQVAFVHFDELYRFARRLTGGDSARADDLVQETYLQAWRTFDRFTPGTNCRAWLYRILFFSWSHDQRRRHGRVIFDSEILEREPLVYLPPPPTELTKPEIIAAFEKLPKAFQVVVLLADVEEMSYRDISDVLDIPMGTVMSRLSRGRSLLRHSLASFARDAISDTAKRRKPGAQ